MERAGVPMLRGRGGFAENESSIDSFEKGLRVKGTRRCHQPERFYDINEQRLPPRKKASGVEKKGPGKPKAAPGNMSSRSGGRDTGSGGWLFLGGGRHALAVAKPIPENAVFHRLLDRFILLTTAPDDATKGQ